MQTSYCLLVLLDNDVYHGLMLTMMAKYLCLWRAGGAGGGVLPAIIADIYRRYSSRHHFSVLKMAGSRNTKRSRSRVQQSQNFVDVANTWELVMNVPSEFWGEELQVQAQAPTTTMVVPSAMACSVVARLQQF